MKVLGMIVIAVLSASCKTTKDNTAQQEVTVTEAEKATGNNDLKEKRWLLIEIGGKPVKHHQTANAPYMILNVNGRLTGSGSCNTFSGNYEVPGLLRIKFSNIAATLKACLDMTVETELMKALSAADNYSISADGKYLSLNRARMTPLAKFEAE
jgi:heat shock protein HslJ